MGRRISVGSPGLTVPFGNTAQRVTDAGNGAIRFNTELNNLELYNGTAWLPVGVLNGVTVTTTFTAQSGQQLFCDTNGGGFTVTLPASPAVGDIIRFFDLRKTFDSNNLTLGRNGRLIQGDAANLTINTEGAAFDIVYSGNSYGWRIFTV
jgi:hypothetical protein|tara:strand:+ start:898 stop:1347 length:450 start_codon:yes stop_codon:yes gene_type:complete